MATMEADVDAPNVDLTRNSAHFSGNATTPKDGVSFRDATVGHKEPILEIQNQMVDKIEYTTEDDKQWEDVDAVFENYFADDQVIENPPWPQIRLTGEEKRDMCKSWGRSLVIKLLGKAIRFDTLAIKLPILWKLQGQFELVEMGMGFFFVKLQKRSDYDSVLTDGPWVLLQHYLTVRRWSPNFKASTTSISSTLAWVRLPELPIQLFNRLDKLKEIGDCIGRFVKVDDHTIRASKGRYARIAVEIDLKKPLLPKYLLGSEEFNIEYEGIRMICFHCGVFGHHQEECPQSPEALARKEKEAEADLQQRVNEAQQAAATAAPKYGAWMIASNRRRTNYGKSVENPGRSEAAKSYYKPPPRGGRRGKEYQPTSAFSALQDLEEDFMDAEHGVIRTPGDETLNMSGAQNSNMSSNKIIVRPSSNLSQANGLASELLKIPVPIKNQVPIKSVHVQPKDSSVDENMETDRMELSRRLSEKRSPLAPSSNNQSEKSIPGDSIPKDSFIAKTGRTSSSMNKTSSRRTPGEEGSKSDRGRPYDRGPNGSGNRA